MVIHMRRRRYNTQTRTLGAGEGDDEMGVAFARSLLAGQIISAIVQFSAAIQARTRWGMGGATP